MSNEEKEHFEDLQGRAKRDKTQKKNKRYTPMYNKCRYRGCYNFTTETYCSAHAAHYRRGDQITFDDTGDQGE